MNREVIMLLDEEELENNEIQCEEIKYNKRTIKKTSKELKSMKMNDNLSNVNHTSYVAPVKAQRMKLPKFNLTIFTILTIYILTIFNGQYSLKNVPQQSILKIR